MARERLIGQLAPLSPVLHSLPSALGRVAASDVTAPIDLPSFTNSAMDGVAVHSANIASASPERPIRLRIAGTIEAGFAWPGSIAPNEALRIGTGAAVPDGCDLVIPIEEIDDQDGFVEIRAPALPHRNLRFQGEDIQRGRPAVRKGSRLRPQEIGLLAALGIESVEIVPRPSVSIISTGPELLPSATPTPVHDANGPLLAALADDAGARVAGVHKSPGTIEQLRQLIEEHVRTSNLIVTTGGISNGAADSMSTLLESIPGGELWDLRLRPGKHFGIVRLADAMLIALPGNPVAAFVGFELLVRAAIDRLSGQDPNRNASMAMLAEPIGSLHGRTQALRGYASIDALGHVHVIPAGNRGSGVVSSLAEANCLIIIPESAGAFERGAVVQIRWLGQR